MTCKICELIQEKGKEIVYQDERLIVMLSSTPAALGHIIVVPREHYTIIEQVPDDLLAEMFLIANKLSVIIFETLQAHGTNIIIQNGAAAGQQENHFSIHVIPRRQGDNLNFEWIPSQQATEDELATSKLKYEAYTKDLLVQSTSTTQAPQSGVVAKQETEEKDKIKEKQGEENYLLKNLDRIP